MKDKFKLLITISVIFYTIVFAQTASADYEIGEYFSKLPETPYSPPTVNFFSEPTVDEILYNRFEEAILDAAVDNALQSSVTISVSGAGVDFYTTHNTYNINYLLNIYSNVVYNNPQIGNLISGFNVFVESEGSTKIVAIRPMYRAIYNEQTYQSLATNEEKVAYLAKTHNIDAFNDAVKYAYSKAIAPDMTEDWQKLLSIHDYLADTITYSPVIANGSQAEKDAYDAENNYLVYTTYSALVGDRISVCQGYALAFKLLCNMAGIECGYAISDHHIWNIAECNGNYYHIDVTWDDPTSVAVSDGNGNTYISTSAHVLHRNFLRSDADSTTLHTNEGEWTTNMPECDDSDYHNTLIFGELDSIFSRLSWDDGSFWFEAYRHNLNSSTGTVTLDPTGICYRITDNGIIRSKWENHNIEITAVTIQDNGLKFISKIDIGMVNLDIAHFGTTFIPLHLYEDETAQPVKVEYDNTEHYITDSTTFGATLANIPESCKDMDIVAKSYLILEDGSEIWSAPMYARLSDCTLRNVE